MHFCIINVILNLVLYTVLLTKYRPFHWPFESPGHTKFVQLYLGIRCVYTYCTVGQNVIRDVKIALARRDHRKSKFGLRHPTKLPPFFFIANISIILARFTQPDRRISKFGLRHSHDEVQILIFDDPAEEKQSQRLGSGFSPARVLISRDASLKPTFKRHGLLFIFLSVFIPKYTVCIPP